VESWPLEPLQSALAGGLVPVIYGDVVFDRQQGGTILSTEDLLTYLASRLYPSRMLLAGIEPGVWADFPARSRLLEAITPADLATVDPALGASAATDVTGGMGSKVRGMLELTGRLTGMQAWIFSGETPGAVEKALLGQAAGTRLSA
jgi:isopentenyl phosphate kinase